jgi:hypothetical protein
MSREKEGYREQLESLRQRFPDREAIDIKEAAKIIGVCDRTLMSNSAFPKKYANGRSGKYIVPLVGLARWMS